MPLSKILPLTTALLAGATLLCAGLIGAAPASALTKAEAGGKSVVSDSTLSSFRLEGEMGGQVTPATPSFSGHQVTHRVHVLHVVATAKAGLAQVTPATSQPAYNALPMFKVAVGNQQGLAYHAKRLYVSYDAGGGESVICTYSMTGKLLSTSPKLPLQHAAELSFRDRDGLLYVANGGTHAAELTKVYALAMTGSKPHIKRTYDLTSLGINGMVAVDNIHDRMLVFSGPTGGPYKATWVNFSTGATTPAFTFSNTDTPQGIEIVRGQVWLYSNDSAGAHITIYSEAGVKVTSFPVNIHGEAEGLAVDDSTNQTYIGAHSPNRVMKLMAYK